jgi:hypothetical protein
MNRLIARLIGAIVGIVLGALLGFWLCTVVFGSPNPGHHMDASGVIGVFLGAPIGALVGMLVGLRVARGILRLNDNAATRTANEP